MERKAAQMNDDSKNASRASALIEVKDLFGLSGAAKIIAEGIVRGGGGAFPISTILDHYTIIRS